MAATVVWGALAPGEFALAGRLIQFEPLAAPAEERKRQVRGTCATVGGALSGGGEPILK